MRIYRITPGGDPDDLAANAEEITTEQLAALPLAEQADIILTSAEIYLPMVGGAVVREDLVQFVETALKGVAESAARRAAATCEAQAVSWDREWDQTRSDSVRKFAAGARRAGQAILSGLN